MDWIKLLRQYSGRGIQQPQPEYYTPSMVPPNPFAHANTRGSDARISKGKGSKSKPSGSPITAPPISASKLPSISTAEYKPDLLNKSMPPAIPPQLPSSNSQTPATKKKPDVSTFTGSSGKTEIVEQATEKDVLKTMDSFNKSMQSSKQKELDLEMKQMDMQMMQMMQNYEREKEIRNTRLLTHQPDGEPLPPFDPSLLNAWSGMAGKKYDLYGDMLAQEGKQAAASSAMQQQGMQDLLSAANYKLSADKFKYQQEEDTRKDTIEELKSKRDFGLNMEKLRRSATKEENIMYDKDLRFLYDGMMKTQQLMKDPYYAAEDKEAAATEAFESSKDWLINNGMNRITDKNIRKSVSILIEAMHTLAVDTPQQLIATLEKRGASKEKIKEYQKLIDLTSKDNNATHLLMLKGINTSNFNMLLEGVNTPTSEEEKSNE